jgi:hypothetical protein
MSRQELAEAVAADLFEHTGRSFGISAQHIAAFERGRHRWPSAHYRTAIWAVLGTAGPQQAKDRWLSPKKISAREPVAKRGGPGAVSWTTGLTAK